MTDTNPPLDPMPHPNPTPPRSVGPIPGMIPPNMTSTAPGTIIIQNQAPAQPWLGRMFSRIVLFMSIIANISLFGLYQQYYPQVTSNEVFKEGKPFAEDKIALIPVTGMIMHETIGAPIKELETAAKDDKVKAVVLAVESPGGTITGSDELYHAIVQFREKTKNKKPLVVSMQGMATSGAYYIAMPADVIIADRSCITGSIGVIASLVNAKDLLDKIGVRPEVIKSGKLKDSGSMFRPMTEEERKEWQGLIDAMFLQFYGIVENHRGEKVKGKLPPDKKLLDLCDGRVFLAKEALAYGLIDEIGYQSDAIKAAQTLANLDGEEVRIVTYRRPLASLFSLFETKAPGWQGASADVARLLDMQVPRFWLLPGTHLGFANTASQ